MSSSLSGDYLRWLAPQIREDDGLSNPNKEYVGLVELMFETPFAFFDSIPRDENRMGDGYSLRYEFCNERDMSTDSLNFLGDASFLEVLIGLSRRLAFLAGHKSAPGWAWILLVNLHLHRAADPLSRTKARKVTQTLERCIRREYEPDGTGGFFPLRNPQEDQREVEIWYQMAVYINEMEQERR